MTMISHVAGGGSGQPILAQNTFYSYVYKPFAPASSQLILGIYIYIDSTYGQS